jgi:type IV pilus assembly protein PilQ
MRGILCLLALAIAISAYARDPQDSITRHNKWIGKPITIHATSADLGDLLRLIAEASGFNLVLGDQVQGTMKAIDWQDVPWDQALDVILKTKHLRAERDGNMLRIMTNEEYVKDIQERALAKAAAEANRGDSTSVEVIRH